MIQGFVQQEGSQFQAIVHFTEAGKQKRVSTRTTSQQADRTVNQLMNKSLTDRVKRYLNHREHVMKAAAIKDWRYARTLHLITECKRWQSVGGIAFLNWVQQNFVYLCQIAPHEKSVYYQHDQQILQEIAEDVKSIAARYRPN